MLALAATLVLGAPASAQSAPDVEAKRLISLFDGAMAGGRWTYAEDYARKLCVLLAANPGVNELIANRCGEAVSQPLSQLEKYAEADALLRAALAAGGATSGGTDADMARVASALGVNLVRQGRFKEAAALIEPALAAAEAKAGKDAAATWDLMDALAALRAEQGRYAEAEALWARILVLRENGEEAWRGAGYAAGVGAMMRQQGRNAEAEALYRKWIAVMEAKAGPGGESALLVDLRAGLGRAAMNRGRLDEAIVLLAAAAPASERLNGYEHRITDAYRMALLEARLKRDDRIAAVSSSDTVSISNGLILRPDSGLPAYTDYLIARASQTDCAESFVGKSTDGDRDPLVLYRKALERRRAIYGADHPRTAAAEAELARCLLDLGRPGEAEPLALEALAVREKWLGPDHPLTTESLETLALLIEPLGRRTEALGLWRRVVAVRGKALDPRAIAAFEGRIRLAVALDRAGRGAEAEALWLPLMGEMQAAMGPTAGQKRLNLLFRTLVGMIDHGVASGQCRGYSEQMGKIQAGMPFSGGAPTPLKVQFHVAYAKALACDGRFSEANEAFSGAAGTGFGLLGDDDPTQAATYVAWAETLLDAPQDKLGVAGGGPGGAAQTAVRMALRRRANGASALDGGGETDAAAFGANLRYLWPQIDDVKFEKGVRDTVFAIMATPEEIKGRVREIGDGYRGQAFVSAQDLSLSAAGQALARAAARRLAGDGELGVKVRRQQDLAERVARISAQLLGGAAAGGGGTSGLRDELAAAQTELAALDAEIRQRFPKYAELAQPRGIEVAEVRKRLKPGEGVVLIVPADADIHVFAVSGTAVAWNRVKGGRALVEARVTALRCQLDPATCGERGSGVSRGLKAAGGEGGGAAGARAYDLAAAHGLYKDLIAPVEGALAGVDSLYVTASGALSGLPLGVLATSGGDDLGKAQWLSDRYALTTLPAVSSLRAMEGQARLGAASAGKDVAFLGFGDPVLGADTAPAAPGRRVFAGEGLADPQVLRTSLASLPGTQVELRAMAKALGAPAGALFLGRADTETALKGQAGLSRARVIAFATHGLIPREIGGLEEPGLVFTPPGVATREDDGVLTASEAAALSLTADWLILSACNTAAADGAPGADSLSGLARGFLYAGAKALLASHWRVQDDVTAALTVEALGQSMRDPSLSRAQALRKAMAAVRTGRRADGSVVEGWTPAWAHPAAWGPFVLISAGE